MRHIRFVMTALVGALALGSLGAAPAVPAAATAANVPGATPATSAMAPMTAQDLAARQALNDFFHAMFMGDAKALSFLVYSDLDDKKQPKNQSLAETMFSEVLAEQRLRMAAHAAFGIAADNALDARVNRIGKGSEEIAAFENDLAAASVRTDQTSKTASIQMGAGPSFVVVLKADKWMVDFDKTQTNLGPLPNGPEITTLARQSAGYNQLAKDVAAKKFGALDELVRQIDKVDTEADVKIETQPVPSTKP